MDIYVLSSDNDILDVVDSYKSAIWDLRYNAVGEFELYIEANAKNVRLLKNGNRLVRDTDIINDEMYHVMMIKKVELITDEEDGDNLVVTGQDLKSIVYQRIVWSQTILSGTVESCIKKLIYENIISPDVRSRQIDNFILYLPNLFLGNLKQQITGDNLGDVVSNILNTNQAGWDIYIDQNNNYVMTLYAGLDRSISQNTNSQVIFSDDNENIISDAYSLDYSDYKNIVVVAGEGEGLARRRVVVGKDTKGLDRYETYKDARGVSSNNGDVSDVDYNDMLIATGNDTLSELSFVAKYEGKIETKGMYVYGKHYNLGDIVTIVNKYGVTANPRITGVIESVSDDGVTIVPSLSTWIGD